MYCKNCGSQIDDNAYVCPHCGVKQVDDSYRPAEDDAPSAGFGILGFLFPIVGIILYAVWRRDYPKRSRSAGIGALISFILWVIGVVSMIILGSVL
ncbi:MAG: zinc ribbon domain-containing protein [Clostridia bacterium]|nr:zinc ribbon domain-containing protein [Clostridia bacterium]